MTTTAISMEHDLNRPHMRIVPLYAQDSVQWQAFLMCVLAGVFYCYEYYLRVAPSVIQPQLMEAFNISQGGLGTLVAYYYLAYVPLQLPAGLMMDYWGPRRVLTVACLCCALGTYLFAFSDALVLAKAGRFMVGFGSAFAYVGVLKLANIWLPHRYFAMMAGICTALGMFGAMSGGIVMAKFVALSSWQQSLYGSAIIGFLLTAALWLIVRDKSDREFRSIGRASHKGLNIWTELWAVIKTSQLWINGVIGCLLFLPLTAFAEFWSVSYLEVQGLSKQSAALGASCVFLGFGLGGPIWGRTSDFIKSRRKPLMAGAICSSAVAVYLLDAQPVELMLLYTTLFALGFFASAQILVFAVGEDTCKPEMSATTVAFTNLLVMLGGFLLQPLVGILLERMPVVTVDGFRLALLVMPIGLILAAVLTFFLRESYPENIDR